MNLVDWGLIVNLLKFFHKNINDFRCLFNVFSYVFFSFLMVALHKD